MIHLKIHLPEDRSHYGTLSLFESGSHLETFYINAYCCLDYAKKYYNPKFYENLPYGPIPTGDYLFYQEITYKPHWEKDFPIVSPGCLAFKPISGNACFYQDRRPALFIYSGTSPKTPGHLQINLEDYILLKDKLIEKTKLTITKTNHHGPSIENPIFCIDL